VVSRNVQELLKTKLEIDSDYPSISYPSHHVQVKLAMDSTMMEKNIKPLKIALHGMDGRTIKTMIMFLQRSCKGIAYVVDNTEDADVDIFDEDSPPSRILMEKHLRENRSKPTIIFSLNACVRENVLHVQKPVNASDMLDALNNSKAIIDKIIKVNAVFESSPRLQFDGDEHNGKKELDVHPELKTFLFDNANLKKTAQHQTAMSLDEREFDDYIGEIDAVDFNDPNQLDSAHYDPYDYFQGTLQCAFAECQAKKQIFLLESDWQPIALFPRTNELWTDSGDEELRYIARLKLKHKKMTSKFNLTQLDPVKVDLASLLYNFQNMDAFMWKLACWTSLGRYPNDIDYNQPVFLKNWPNFTRLLITPHALKIAALLVQNPRTMANIAQTLNIRPQYVFVFISAAYAVGLAGQARRISDTMVEVKAKKRSFRDALSLSKLVNKSHPYKA
jgi:hypothetical protein